MKKLFLLLFCFVLVIGSTGCAKQLDFSPEKNATTLSDGTILYDEAKVSKEALIELKDEDKILILDNDEIKKIYAKHNEQNGYFIEIKLSKKGAKKLAEATEDNIGRNLGLFVDGSPFAIAQVVAVIDSGSFCLPPFDNEAQLLQSFEMLT